MAHDDIEGMLDHLRRIKNEGDLDAVKIDRINALEVDLGFFRTFILPDSLLTMRKKVQLIGERLHLVFGGSTYECKTTLNVERLVSQLLEFSECNTSSRYHYEVNDLYLPEYMDNLDKNLNDLLGYDVTDKPLINKFYFYGAEIFWKKVVIIKKKMSFMRDLYTKEIKGHIDYDKLEGLESRIQFMADNVGQFCFSTLDFIEDDTNSDDIFCKPPHLLQLIALVQMEMQIFLGELKNSKFRRSRNFKDQKFPKGFSHHHFHSLLLYLRNKKLKNLPNNVSARNIDVAIELLLVIADVPNHIINDKMLNEILEKVGALVGDVLGVIQKLLPHSIKKDDTDEINLCSTQILEKSENLKEQMGRYYKSLEYTPSQLPAVGALSFLNSLLRKLNEMLKSESGSDFMMKPHLAALEKELSSLTSGFRDVAKVHHEHEILKKLQKRTINLAYGAEVAIDSILVRYNTLWHLFCSLPAIIKEIKIISAEVTEIRLNSRALKPCSVVEPSKCLPIQHSNPMKDEEIVGFNNDIKNIIQYLIRGENELDVIPIVGMGGQGKTTCARKLYNNDSIVSRFDVRVWCIISQIYNWGDLLRQILSQVTNSKDMVEEDNVVADMLRKRLMGKRYLIVLDDMWDGKVWNDLRSSFPDVKNGSRIIVTTRLKEVGKHVKHFTDPYFLPFLTLEESCELLQKKVFQKECCPHELHKVCLAVAERCKGLPLMVILVAGIISKNKMEASWWHEVGNDLLSYLAKSSEDYSMATMQLSYDNLPNHIRPCLLYMGMFLEDEIIPVPNLIKLWIAEGFVETIESGRLEDAAEGYLMDLISRNLVMVSRIRYDGKVRLCQVHDIVLQFCLVRSSEEKFVSVVKGHYSQFRPFDWQEYRLCYHITNQLSKSPLLNQKKESALHHNLRSLITKGRLIRGWDPTSEISKLRLLKVLDLRSYFLDNLSSPTMHPLVHLKYLAVRTKKFDFQVVSHLRYLETLLIVLIADRFPGADVTLPATFWKMERLKHVEIHSNNIYHLRYLETNKQEILEESSKLENLRVLSQVHFSFDQADCLMDVLLRRCPNLQELGTRIQNSVRDSTCPEIRLSVGFQNLQSFSVTTWGRITEFHLPLNLKKLEINGYITRRAVSMIAELPSLEYLNLTRTNYPWDKWWDEWCLTDITFHKLKVLKLAKLYVSRWDASDESFPQLETLVIKECDYLQLPLSFAYIQTLKQIQLIRCENEPVEVSALKIKEEVEEIEGTDRLEVIIEKR